MNSLTLISVLIVSLVVLATGRRGHHRYHYHHREKPKVDVSKPEETGNDKNKPIAVEPDKSMISLLVYSMVV